MDLELSLQPDIYEPILDESGNYIDEIPASNKFTNGVGITCPCGTRSNHPYRKRSIFITHTSSLKHQKWLQNINNNKKNYYSENIKLTRDNNNQKLIIANLQRENDDYKTLIAKLSLKLEAKENVVTSDLLTFD